MALGLYELINNINKQIKGICCKIENLDPGGGGGTNIYNSDGLLTGNRTLSGASNDLTFADLNVFKTTSGGTDIGLNLHFGNGEYKIIGGVGAEIVAQDGGIGGGYIILGDYQGNNNTTQFYVDDNNRIIKTIYQGNDIGLKLDFANNIYSLGTEAGGYGISGFWLDWNNCNNYVGDGANNYNGVNLQVNNNPEIIKTQYQLNDIGLKLDFANSLYEFGASDVKTEIDINQGFFNIFYNTNQSTFRTESVGSVYFGDIDSVQNGTYFGVADQNSIIYSKYSGSDIGFKLDFANSVYEFGQITGGNTTYLTIDDTAAYPVQLTGTNVSANTAGAASGQFLKIKVGGVDYKIALLNP